MIKDVRMLEVNDSGVIKVDMTYGEISIKDIPSDQVIKHNLKIGDITPYTRYLIMD